MTRFSTISAIFLTGAFATLLLHMPVSHQPAVFRVDDTELDDKLRERTVTYHCFKSSLNDALHALQLGKISLREACQQVYEAGLRYNPRYIERLQTCESGATPHDRLARNLIGHIARSEDVPNLLERVRALNAELAELECMPQ